MDEDKKIKGVTVRLPIKQLRELRKAAYLRETTMAAVVVKSLVDAGVITEIPGSSTEKEPKA